MDVIWGQIHEGYKVGIEDSAQIIAAEIDALKAENELLRLMQPVANVTLEPATPVIDALKDEIKRLKAEVERLDRITRLQQLAMKNPGIPPGGGLR